MYRNQDKIQLQKLVCKNIVKIGMQYAKNCSQDVLRVEMSGKYEEQFKWPPTCTTCQR